MSSSKDKTSGLRGSSLSSTKDKATKTQFHYDENPRNNFNNDEDDDSKVYDESSDESEGPIQKKKFKSSNEDTSPNPHMRSKQKFSKNQIQKRINYPSARSTPASAGYSQSGTSQSRSSPSAGSSVDMQYVYTSSDYITRLQTVEHKMSQYEDRFNKLEEAFARKNQFDHNEETNIELQTWQISTIGTFVRDEMFKAIKFLDLKILRSQGQKIFDRALKAMNLGEQSGNKLLYSIVIKKCKHYLNNHKCHVISNIREQAKGTISLKF
jgi:hypothetical protein